MAIRGKKPLPQVIHLATGTDQPCRRHEAVVQPLPGTPVRPKWLKGRELQAAVKIWNEKIEKYTVRGLSVVGMEDSLAQYCVLEADLIDQWSKGLRPAIAQVNAYRMFANEFHDTPASNLKHGPDNKPGNRFGNNGIKK